MGVFLSRPVVRSREVRARPCDLGRLSYRAAGEFDLSFADRAWYSARRNVFDNWFDDWFGRGRDFIDRRGDWFIAWELGRNTVYIARRCGDCGC